MGVLENVASTETLGKVQSRYVWEEARHHIQNHLLFLLCVVVGAIVLGMSYQSGHTLRTSPILQMCITACVTLGMFFLMRAIHDQMLRHIRCLATIGDRGFSIVKYNEENDMLLEEYVQPYDSLLRIEKHEHDDVSEDGIYLRTVSSYYFVGSDNSFCKKIKYNRNDIRLNERDGMADVKALFAIERAYNASCQTATITHIAEPETVIPSRPQPVIRLKTPVMWRDVE